MQHEKESLFTILKKNR